MDRSRSPRRSQAPRWSEYWQVLAAQPYLPQVLPPLQFQSQVRAWRCEPQASGQVCCCGNVLTEDSLFCLKCGTKRPQVSERCCGIELTEDALFCRKCGTKRAQVSANGDASAGMTEAQTKGAIRSAIAEGAPAYNRQDVNLCVAIFLGVATKALRDLDPGSAMAARLKRGVVEAEGASRIGEADNAAWALRYAFDESLAMPLSTAIASPTVAHVAVGDVVKSSVVEQDGGKTLLVISCSPMGENSATKQIGKSFCEAYAKAFPDDGIRILDLCGADAPPPFLASRAQAKFKTFGGTEKADADAEWQVTKKIINDFKSADKYVFLVPMWNFHLPYVLKQYFDHIVQPHLTFALPDMKGQVSGKPALIVMASGGVPIGCPMDLGTPYLKAVLGFIGFTDIRLFGVSNTSTGGNDLIKKKAGEVKELAAKFAFDKAAKLDEATAPEIPAGVAAEVKKGAKVLLITASPMGGSSATGKACKGFLDALKAKDGTVEVTTLDVSDGHLKEFTAARVQAKIASWQEATLKNEVAKKEWEYTEGLIEQFKAADVYVFAVPMWNFFMPYTLKQYLDHIVQPHKLFDPANNTGLLKGKRAFVVAASGNGLMGTPLDHITPYMKFFLTFVGVSDASYAIVNGSGGPASNKAIEDAIASLKKFACL